MGKKSVGQTVTKSTTSETSTLKKSTSTTSSKRKGTKFGAKKGKAFERQIAQELGHIFPDAQRRLEYQGSTNAGTDLEATDVFQFQLKSRVNYVNPSIIREIHLEKPDNIPVVVTKGNNRPPMAVLPFEKFVTLLEIAYGHRERFINPYMDRSPDLIAEAPKLLDPPPLFVSEVKPFKRLAILDAELMGGPKEILKDVAETVSHNISLDSFI